MTHRKPAGERDDAGLSMVEILVTMGLMGVVMVIFTAAILQAYRANVKTESAANVQAQLQVAFQRFDRQLRYASWIAQPGQVNDAWYVEWAGYDGSECYQLRLDAGGVLQMLTWPRAATPPVEGTAGQTLATDLVTAGGPPFERQAAGVATGSSAGADFAPDFQRLRVRLTARVVDSTAQVDTTLTALNTSRNTPATNDCGRGRPA